MKNLEEKRNRKKILEGGSNFQDRCFSNYEEAAEFVEHLKALGKKIVLTQGVFDLIHIGHAEYLERAKDCGDILVVGVDSDDVTKQRKGPSRPIVGEDERLRMLSHLRSVDIIVLKSIERDVNDLARVIRPDIVVISETTSPKEVDLMKVVYKDICGEIVCLPAQSETTTSARIRRLFLDGVADVFGKIHSLLNDLQQSFEIHPEK